MLTILQILADNSILDDGIKRGGSFMRIPKEMLINYGHGQDRLKKWRR